MLEKWLRFCLQATEQLIHFVILKQSRILSMSPSADATPFYEPRQSPSSKSISMWMSVSREQIVFWFYFCSTGCVVTGGRALYFRSALPRNERFSVLLKCETLRCYQNAQNDLASLRWSRWECIASVRCQSVRIWRSWLLNNRSLIKWFFEIRWISCPQSKTTNLSNLLAIAPKCWCASWDSVEVLDTQYFYLDHFLAT